MPRHIYLGDDGDAALGSVSLELGALGLSVVLAGEARHARRSIQLRIELRFEAEALVVGQVPVERVDLEAREQVDLFLQFIEADERAAYVVHETAQLEGRIIGDLHAGYRGAIGGGGQLRQRLCGADDARLGGCRDLDCVGRHAKLVAFVVETGESIVESAEDRGIDELHAHAGRGRLRGGEQRCQQARRCGVGDLHRARERKLGAIRAQALRHGH